MRLHLESSPCFVLTSKMSAYPGRNAENEKRFLAAQQLVIKHANEANNNWLKCTRCREHAHFAASMLSLAPMNYGVPCPRLSVCYVSGSTASSVTTAAMKSVFGYTPGRRMSSGLLITLGILYTTTTKTCYRLMHLRCHRWARRCSITRLRTETAGGVRSLRTLTRCTVTRHTLLELQRLCQTTTL
jgi:hypothetical protein